MQSVPFSVEEYEGIVETIGLVRIQEDTLVLEVRKKSDYLVSRFQE